MICEKCKKEMNNKMLNRSDKALKRYTAKLRKELNEMKNDTSKQTKR